jgi:cysteine desulfurase/selenocysteine lyase
MAPTSTFTPGRTENEAASTAALTELCAPFAHSSRVHLNNAGIAPVTARAESALVEVAALMRDGTLAVPALLRRYENARATFARLVGCQTGELAFFQTCAAAISQVALGLPLGSGDELVLLDQEYPSNAYPWHRAAERAKARVITVASRPDLVIDPSAFRDAIGPRCRVVAVSLVQYQSGATFDLAPILEAAHRVGAFVVVDAIQGLGIQSFDMNALGVDAVCGGTQKWLLGPMGHGFLAVTPRLGERLTPLLQGAITYGTPDDPFVVDKPMRADIRRFEPGTPHLLGACAGAASVELLLQAGVEQLRPRAMMIAALVEDRARSMGLSVLPRHDSPFVVVRTRQDPFVVAKHLKDRGIAVGVRAGGLRVTPHAFNTSADVDRLFAELATCPAEA